MAKCVFVYRVPATYRGSASAIAAWEQWFVDLGDALVDRGNPVLERATLGADSADTVLSGYSLVTADSLDDAARFAKACPAMADGGTVEVGGLTELNSGTSRALR